MRPYTIRGGDTLNSICSKRGLEVEDVLNLNTDLNPDVIIAGKTILLPAGKLSERDLEIVEGIRTGGVRDYPVRAGEKLEDILDKRGITMEEFKNLNPDVGKIQDNQVILLPSNKFTVREQEMLAGSGIVPREFFISPNVVVPSIVLGFILGATGTFLYFKNKIRRDDE